ncbi:MAG: KpsF/GutQ family sugar-phosphate isomerase [Elusimicrobiota bacterium]
MNTDSRILGHIREVLDMEARAIHTVKDRTDRSYVRAVRLLSACKGKVLVTGIGKSGLIAQKIAATLASTGTPALYLHPAEALHGGLGAVQKQDVILALGKSGESSELNDILPSLRKLGVRLIAITANPSSTLARCADAVLHLPVRAEACPLNLAPTCSTTASLAVGDALAVALMRLRGFDARGFALLHPGGQLGKRLTLTVADLMHDGKDNPVIGKDASVSQMLLAITRHHTGAVSVVDGRGRLLGLITDYDLRKVLERGEDVRKLSLKSIMNARPTCVRPETLAADALSLMLDRPKPFAVLPVKDRKDRAVGMIHLHDLRRSGL